MHAHENGFAHTHDHENEVTHDHNHENENVVDFITLNNIENVSTTLQTTNIEFNDASGLNTEMGVLYVDPCPYGGKHTMYPHGNGVLYQNGKLIIASGGAAYQCHKCNLAIVSQYMPTRLGKLGKYGTNNPGYRLATSYTMRNPTYVGTANNTKVAPWTGYVWY